MSKSPVSSGLSPRLFDRFQHVEPRIKVARRRLRANTIYLGDDVVSVQKRLKWIENDDHDVVVERVDADENRPISYQAGQITIRRPSAVQLSAIVVLTHDDFWLSSDGGWTGPSKDAPSFFDVKISCTGGNPIQNDLHAEYINVLANIDALIQRNHIPTYAIDDCCTISSLSLERKLKFSHMLFQVRADIVSFDVQFKSINLRTDCLIRVFTMTTLVTTMIISIST